MFFLFPLFLSSYKHVSLSILFNYILISYVINYFIAYNKAYQ